MTEKELREHLATLTGENTDEETVNTVDAIIGSFNSLNTELEETKTNLSNEKERFKNRFWRSEDEGKQVPAYDGIAPASDDQMKEFFKGI